MALAILIISSGVVFAAFELYWYRFSKKALMDRPALFDRAIAILWRLTIASFVAACLGLVFNGRPVRAILLLVLAAGIHFSTDFLAYRKEISVIIREQREFGTDMGSDEEAYKMAEVILDGRIREQLSR